MKFQDWIWLYLGTGEPFTRWIVLLFYGAVLAAAIVIIGLVVVLAAAMAVRP